MPEMIRIRGITAEGRHGVKEEERTKRQAFSVDLELVVEAGEDDLGATADYGEVVPVVRGLVSEESYQLIETLAGRIAKVVAGIKGVLACRAIVHKPKAAGSLGVQDISAEASAESGRA